MRTYSIPVNADFVDELHPTLEDWQDYTCLMHQILCAEYELKLTGAIASAVKGRGQAAHLKDLLGW